jgi:hypothetical protein
MPGSLFFLQSCLKEVQAASVTATTSLFFVNNGPPGEDDLEK